MIALALSLLLAAAPAPTPVAPPPKPASTAPASTTSAAPTSPAPGPPKAPPPVLTAPPPPAPTTGKAAPAAARSGPLRVAVLDPVASPDVPPRPLAALAQSLVPEIRKLEGVSAIGMAEIRDMLGFEYQRQMLGCSADDQCLAEIAGALGVDELVTTHIVLVKKSYAVTMKRLDLKKARVLQSESRTVEQRDGEELLALVGTGVAALFPDRPLRAGRTRGVEPAVVRRLNPPPLPRWAFFATAGAAVLVAGGGAMSQVAVTNATAEYDRVANRSRTSVIPASDLTDASDRVRSLEVQRNTLLYTGAGLAVAAGIEALFTDWKNDRGALATPVAPLALEGGGGVVIAGRF